MKFISLSVVATVVGFASQALASPAPQAATPPTVICPFTTPSTTGPPQQVLQCGDGFFCCQILSNDAFCVTTSFPGSLRCPRIENPPTN